MSVSKEEMEPRIEQKMEQVEDIGPVADHHEGEGKHHLAHGLVEPTRLFNRTLPPCPLRQSLLTA